MNLNEISRINVVAGGDHEQDAFYFLMKCLVVMNYGKILVRIFNITYILGKKYNGIILKKHNYINTL